MYKRILVATDGSELAHKAIAAGVELAALAGATIVGVHVRPPIAVMVYGEASILIPEEAKAMMIKQAKEVARQWLAEVEDAARASNVACKTLDVEDRSPAEAILRVAKENDCDLIVMASHGRRGLSRALLGSETNKVITHADRMVLVAR